MLAKIPDLFKEEVNSICFSKDWFTVEIEIERTAGTFLGLLRHDKYSGDEEESEFSPEFIRMYCPVESAAGVIAGDILISSGIRYEVIQNPLIIGAVVPVKQINVRTFQNTIL